MLQLARGMIADLENKTALVTGASRGIGRSISLALAECGAHVFLAARNLDRLKTVEKQIKAHAGSASILRMDLAKEEEITTSFERVKEECGRLDILVNNAGIGHYATLVDFPVDDFDRTIDINLRSVFLCCREAMRLMIPAGGGYIINVASIQGIKAYRLQAAYAASKHGVMGLTKALAVEAQEHGIRVSAILPGGVDTELIREARPNLDPAQLIRPEDIAQSVLYLLSLSKTAMVDQIVVRRRASSPF